MGEVNVENVDTDQLTNDFAFSVFSVSFSHLHFGRD